MFFPKKNESEEIQELRKEIMVEIDNMRMLYINK